jgi:MtrB/PioB family decaheme-associated outer membrane protein
MNTFTPTPLIAALGLALGGPPAALAAGPVDTSQWACTSCPFEAPGVTGAVQAGVADVSAASARHGDYTGLGDRGVIGQLGGEFRFRDAEGLHAEGEAADLGLDVRSLRLRGGKEGVVSLRFGYSEIDHQISDGAFSAYRGIGTDTLTLPAGATLQPVGIGFKRKRLEAGARADLSPGLSARVDIRHDERHGTQRTAGAFFTSAAQLLAPVNDMTEQIEMAATYRARAWHVTLGYLGSLYHNEAPSLTWANPFTPLVAGADTGQLARAPRNTLHQLSASAAWAISPALRAAGDLAWGRITQDATFLPATVNTGLAAGALPVQSLDGVVDTFNASARLAAQASERLRLTATYAHDARDNRTGSHDWPAVSTDMFVGATPRTNTSYRFTRDRLRLGADLRGAGSLRASVGLDGDLRSRTHQEVVSTREATVWARVGGAPVEGLSLALKLAHGQRGHSTYGTVPTLDPAENPLLRKFYLADRQRDSVTLRADVTPSQAVSLGFDAGIHADDYSESAVGLLSGQGREFGVDLGLVISDDTRLNAYAQIEKVRSNQASSQAGAQPDWLSRVRDVAETAGLRLTHRMLRGQLEISADAAQSRTRSDLTVVNGVDSVYPTAMTHRDTVKLNGTWHWRKDLSLLGGLGYERYTSRDWHLDGVQTGTVPDLLSLGIASPRHEVTVLSVGARYQF